ncbi:MAG TPA: hypothetical protein VHX44_01815 [Planctomycetota bacterium]|nr:hypothetical protein [Planctomycetota bacterium]
MRTLFLIPLLAGSVASAVAVDGVDGLKGISLTFDVISYASQEFSVGYMSDHWSSGQRYELNAVTQLDGDRVRPSGGMYFFFEDRDWKGKFFTGVGGTTQERANMETWGFGLQGGATIHLIEPEKKLWLALVPLFRAGLGFVDFEAKDVVIDNARYDLQSGSGRIELAAGLDLRLTLAQRFEVVFGGGVDYWSAADVAIYAGTGGGGIAVGSNGTFTGTDAYVRFGVGLHF